MADISREPSFEVPGQRDTWGGDQRKGPVEWTRAEGLSDSVADDERDALERITDWPEEPVSGPADPDPDPGPEEEIAAIPEGQLAGVLCALLLSSREPISLLRLAQTTDTTPAVVRDELDRLTAALRSADLPLEVDIAGEQVRLLTTPDVFPWLRPLRTARKQEKLSAAALETLAVIAYRQPVIRAEIEAIRGVKAGPILRTLLEHRMVKTVGRADVPGRPLQYGTTQHFLETFGLESLADLPSVKEFRQL